jgi:leader peptidase (prepilin peptidase)/N-methyltransferase
MLRRTCRAPAEPSVARRPLAQLGVVLGLAAVAIWFALARWQSGDAAHLAASIVELAAFLYLAVITVPLAVIDLEVHRLPNRIVLPSYLVGGALLGGASAIARDWAALVTMLAGGAALFVVYFAVAVGSPRGMGFGDVKLAGVLGLFLGHLGVPQLIVGAFAAFLLGGLFAIALLVARRAGRASAIPFGPWMLAGTWAGITAGAPLTDAYLALFGLAV